MFKVVANPLIYCCKTEINIEYQVSPHQKLAVCWSFSSLNPCYHHHNIIRSGQMTYRLKALISTVILAPILGGGVTGGYVCSRFFNAAGSQCFSLGRAFLNPYFANVWKLSSNSIIFLQDIVETHFCFNGLNLAKQYGNVLETKTRKSDVN